MDKKMEDAIKELFRGYGKEGGKKSAASPIRTKEYYKALAKKSVEARKKKANLGKS